MNTPPPPPPLSLSLPLSKQHFCHLLNITNRCQYILVPCTVTQYYTWVGPGVQAAQGLAMSLCLSYPIVQYYRVPRKVVWCQFTLTGCKGRRDYSQLTCAIYPHLTYEQLYKLFALMHRRPEKEWHTLLTFT